MKKKNGKRKSRRGSCPARCTRKVDARGGPSCFSFAAFFSDPWAFDHHSPTQSPLVYLTALFCCGFDPSAPFSRHLVIYISEQLLPNSDSSSSILLTCSPTTACPPRTRYCINMDAASLAISAAALELARVAGEETLLPRSSCSTGNEFDGQIGLRVSAIFVIWFSSTMGGCIHRVER